MNGAGKHTHRHKTTTITATLCLALTLTACGQPHQTPPDKTELRIGLLLPENQTARYEQFDRPLIEKKIKELCNTCTVQYANARNDPGTQRQQLDAMITKGVDVLILDAVDVQGIRSAVTEAKNAGIPVIAYDRDAEGPISAYVSYDDRTIGRLQAEALLKAVGTKRDHGLIVRLEGPSKASRLVGPFVRGAQPALKGKIKVSKPYRAAEWDAGSAQIAMSGAIAAEGIDNIKGVWNGNDVLADGAIAALKKADITPLPPVVGQDAELAAIQRIINGEQYMTVYKPYKPQADTAATLAVTLGRGKNINNIAKDHINTPTTHNIPAALLTPIPVTATNIKTTVIKDRMYTINQICTPEHRPACNKTGLTN